MSNSSNYTYSILEQENVEDLNQLYQAAFLRSPKPNAFRWKYFSNPAGNALVAGAFSEGKLVASGAMIPENSSLFGKDEIIYKCTDLMTHPEHQKKGLSKKVNELLKKKLEERGARLCYTLCSTVSTKSFLKNNWQYMGRVFNYFQPLPILKLKTLFGSSLTEEFKLFSFSSDKFDSFISSAAAEKIRIKKDHSFLQWRSSNPKFSYKIICSYGADQKINGHLVFSETESRILNVLDLEAETPSIKDQLLCYFERWASKSQIRGLVILCVEGTPLHAYLKTKKYLRNPFLKGPLTSTLDFNILQLAEKGIEASTEAKSWDLCGLNYDDV